MDVGVVKLLLDRGADLEVGIETEKDIGNVMLLDVLNQVKLPREERRVLSAEVTGLERKVERSGCGRQNRICIMGFWVFRKSAAVLQ